MSENSIANDALTEDQKVASKMLTEHYENIVELVDAYLSKNGINRKVGEISFVDTATERRATNPCTCHPGGTWVPYCSMCDSGRY